MTSFILRIPTLVDLNTFRHQLPEATYHSLFEKHSDSFHLKDTCVTLWKEGLGFRPVLQAETTKTLSSIQDGTSLQMPCPEVPGLIYLSDAQNACWMKCGNLLIASRNITGEISYDRLVHLGLLHGCSVEADFDRAASLMLYRMLMSQPESQQRSVSEIMYDLTNKLKQGDHFTQLSEDQIYILAKRIHAWSQKSLFSCGQMVDALVDIQLYGLSKESFQNYKFGACSDFSPAACISTLCTGDEAIFRTLLGFKLRSQVIFDSFYEDLSHNALKPAFVALIEQKNLLEGS